MSKRFKGLTKGFSLGVITMAVLGSIHGIQAQEATFNGPGDIQAAVINDRYVVTFKNTADILSDGKIDPAAVMSLMQTYGAETIRTLDSINGVAIKINPSDIANLLNNKQIANVEVDQPRYLLDDQHLLAESTPYGITMVQADQVSDAASGNQKVCIVDTGYNRDHNDLRTSNVTGDDNDGQGNDTGNWYNDGHGHGSHVAGTISALGGNNLGVVGVNPSGNVGLHIVKVFNDAGNWAYGSDLIAAISQCEAAGASVISMSLGGGASMSSESNAFASALANGVLSIAAAGNDGNSTMSYPASYDSVMSVAAVDSSENKASFSQYNAQVEIAGPGVGVESTITGQGYASWSGTSMATPHVSGVAALVWSNHPACTATEIRNILNATAKDKGSAGRDTSYGYGIVQAKAAVDAISANGCGDIIIEPPEGDDVTITDLAESSGSWYRNSFEMPADVSTLTVTISGGSGDADLYVKEGSAPSSGWFGSYDCRPYLNGNDEVCTFTNPGTGSWHIGVKAYSTFNNVTLNWNYR